jgi:hypothetical protein
MHVSWGAEGMNSRMPLRDLSRERTKSIVAAFLATATLGALIVIGSRQLHHFDAALVGYTFATLFATFGIGYRYAMWLQRPPTRMYWRRGWQVFTRPRFLARNLGELARRFFVEFIANRFIWRRGRLRWTGHWLIMWGCLIGAAVTFPLVWGWVHFETVPGRFDVYRAFVFGFPMSEFEVESIAGVIVFHALVWASFLVVAGVLLAFRRRMIDHGAAALQQFGEDILPLLMLFAVSITGIMLTVSYSWMKGYAYDFLAILHAVTVILTLLWLPFGKFFHIFQRPAQLGASFYKDVGQTLEQAPCARCGTPFASVMMLADLETVERELGFRYEGKDGAPHYQRICPKCRRALFGLAQGALWRRSLGARLDSAASHEPARKD